MSFDFESVLGGSHTNFKRIERPPYSEDEKQLRTESFNRLQDGLIILRQFRTAALEETDQRSRFVLLRQAHEFSESIAAQILSHAAEITPTPLADTFLQEISGLKEKFKGRFGDSGHNLPPSNSISNLQQFSEDLLLRVQEKAGSYLAPNHKLNHKETEYLIREFQVDVNNLSLDAMEEFLTPGTRIGGILSGGAVAVEIVKQVLSRYTDLPFPLDTFVIAVDKHNGLSAFEVDTTDPQVKNVIITDDLIDRGGTVITALWSAGEFFPNARIHSGKGIDYPGGFAKRTEARHREFIGDLFIKVDDAIEAGDMTTADALYDQAVKYSGGNHFTLSPAWDRLSQRIKRR